VLSRVVVQPNLPLRKLHQVAQKRQRHQEKQKAVSFSIAH
jgi:hypothetical protein